MTKKYILHVSIYVLFFTFTFSSFKKCVLTVVIKFSMNQRNMNRKHEHEWYRSKFINHINKVSRYPFLCFEIQSIIYMLYLYFSYLILVISKSVHAL